MEAAVDFSHTVGDGRSPPRIGPAERTARPTKHVAEVENRIVQAEILIAGYAISFVDTGMFIAGCAIGFVQTEILIAGYAISFVEAGMFIAGCAIGFVQTEILIARAAIGFVQAEILIAD